MKRIASWVACIVLTMLLLVSGASAEPRYPAHHSAVNDTAAVFSADTATELNSVISEMELRTNVSLSVATVDFLDGYDMDTYLSGLFTKWAFNNNDVLLLIAVGEDKCGVKIGSGVHLSDTTVQKLIVTYLEPAVRAQDYESALYSFIPRLVGEIGKAYNVNLSSGTFAQPVATTAPPSQTDLLDRWQAGRTTAARTTTQPTGSKSGKSSGSFGSFLLAMFLLWMFFGKGSRRYRSMRNGCGCGCSPFAKLFALLGLARIWHDD